jgi:hypothetical protein
VTAGSQASQRGRYQLRSPSRRITAGTSTPRTTVASSRIAAARPTPTIFKVTSDRVAKIANTATITTAALVTTPAERRMPCSMAAWVEAPRS